MLWTWRKRQWQPTPGLLPGKSHGQRRVGYSPWRLKESDMTERLHFHFSLSCTGEGNGNPLQYSCLENPRDGGALWAASMGSHRVGHNWSDLAAAAAWTRNWYGTGILKNDDFYFPLPYSRGEEEKTERTQIEKPWSILHYIFIQ